MPIFVAWANKLAASSFKDVHCDAEHARYTYDMLLHILRPCHPGAPTTHAQKSNKNCMEKFTRASNWISVKIIITIECHENTFHSRIAPIALTAETHWRPMWKHSISWLPVRTTHTWIIVSRLMNICFHYSALEGRKCEREREAGSEIWYNRKYENRKQWLKP